MKYCFDLTQRLVKQLLRSIRPQKSESETLSNITRTTFSSRAVRKDQDALPLNYRDGKRPWSKLQCSRATETLRENTNLSVANRTISALTGPHLTEIESCDGQLIIRLLLTCVGSASGTLFSCHRKQTARCLLSASVNSFAVKAFITN